MTGSSLIPTTLSGLDKGYHAHRILSSFTNICGRSYITQWPTWMYEHESHGSTVIKRYRTARSSSVPDIHTAQPLTISVCRLPCLTLATGGHRPTHKQTQSLIQVLKYITYVHTMSYTYSTYVHNTQSIQNTTSAYMFVSDCSLLRFCPLFLETLSLSNPKHSTARACHIFGTYVALRFVLSQDTLQPLLHLVKQRVAR